MYTNTENVKRLIEERVEAMEQITAEDHFLEQANARVESRASFMLNKLAQRLGLSRSALAGELLASAIVDAWYFSDMPMVDAAGSKLPAIYGEGELADEYKAYMAERGVKVQ